MAIAAWGGEENFKLVQQWVDLRIETSDSLRLFIISDPFKVFPAGSFKMEKKETDWIGSHFQKKPKIADKLSFIVFLLMQSGCMSNELATYLFESLTDCDDIKVQIAAIKGLGHLGIDPALLEKVVRLAKDKRVRHAAKSELKLVQYFQSCKSQLATRDADFKGQSIFEPIEYHGFVEGEVVQEGASLLVNHAKYGKIPVQKSKRGELLYLECSRTHKPNLPPKAFRADVTKQNLVVPPNSEWFPIPRYYYSDEYFNCKDCKQESMFSAELQRSWYENHQLPIYARPTRCLDCYRKHRGLEKLSDIVDELAHDPTNPDLLLEEAKYRIYNARHLSAASLQRATHCLRLVEGVMPELVEVFYWYAAIAENANDNKKALDFYQKFVARSDVSSKLFNDANERIVKLTKRSSN